MQKEYKLNDFEKEILQYQMQIISHPRIWNEEEKKPIWWEDKGGTTPLSDQILQLTNRETSGKEDRIKYLR